LPRNLKVRTFDTQHKADWYAKLYGQNLDPTSKTPLRGSRASADLRGCSAASPKRTS
jgi:hypothetical protein